MILRSPICLVIAANLALTPGRAQQGADPAENLSSANASTLQRVIVLSRHGVRAPLQTKEDLYKFSKSAWPTWDAPPGNLTSHGKLMMTSLGSFYAAYYESLGMFRGSGCDRSINTYVWSDVDERDISTAKSFLDGVFPGCAVKINSVPEGQQDELFHSLKAHFGEVDRERAVAEVLGRVGGDAEYVKQAYMPAFLTLDRILGGCGKPSCADEEPGRQVLFAMKATMESAEDKDHLIQESKGPLGIGSTLSEIMLLEYADGKPMNEVGFGRMSRDDLTQILGLHSVYFDLSQETSYEARTGGSNMLSHILNTLYRVPANDMDEIPGGFGLDSSRFIFIAAHDTNIANVAGMLHAHWYLPNEEADPTSPGGGLVFELWRHERDKSLWVRTRYISETLDQMHDGQVVSIANPPAIVPIFLPACSVPTGQYECPLELFKKLASDSLLPSFITPSPSAAIPPSVHP
jgi:4-phytase/acid phosphatase